MSGKDKSLNMYKKAKKLIPGGTQLLSKRPEMFLPDYWPAYYSKGKGCEVWDLDGNSYIDMTTMGIGCCILGYADEDVDKAVIKVIKNANMTSLNAPEEIELAELLCELHPWADMVRYTRSGGEAMSVAVRIGRAYSEKDTVLFCGYHGWHDWYLSSNLYDENALDQHLLQGLDPNGVPNSLKSTSMGFMYNDKESFLKVFEKNKENTGVIVLETVRNEPPDQDFIDAIQEMSKKHKIAFIVDEITSGWRLNLGGAHLLYDIKPDIAVFAKGISNGYPMAAIIGREEVMQSAQTSFISSTYWTERIGPTAALATIKKMKNENVQTHLVKVGKGIQKTWADSAVKNGLDIHLSGIYPLSHFSFVHDKPLVLKTLFTQKMLKKGFLASTAFYSSFAHRDEHVFQYASACNEVFSEIANILQSGVEIESELNGPVCHAGFQRLN